MNTSAALQKVQSRLLEMSKKIAAILESHQIPYMIAFGTLLGAVRHKGFIPWDDDFDFFLFDDSYESAMEILQKELPADMFLENEKTEPNFFHAWSRVKDIGSICEYEQFPQDVHYKHNGLCVDLFRLTKIPAKNFAKFRFEQAIEYLERRKSLGFITDAELEQRKAAYAKRKLDDEKKDFHGAEEIFATPLNNAYRFIDDVLPLKKYTFEDTSFYGPANAENCLKLVYGDWKALPPVEKRIPHYSSVIFTKEKYKVGITVGVFDLFHVGHLNLLERCKSMCEHLIVAVCGDDYVTQVKHQQPIYSEKDRMRLLAALKVVDEVILVSLEEIEDKMLLLKNHPFNVLFSGDDWKGSERYRKTEAQFAKLGASIEYFPYTKGISTSQIKKQVASYGK